MAAWFSLPSMLWWGLGATLPILIHLFMRQRYRRIRWAAMTFLQNAFRRTRRRVRLENLLLLALRCLVLLLLALALADPRTSRSAVFGSAPESARNVVLAVDSSLSMGARDAAGTQAIDQSRSLALALLRTLRDRRDRVAVVDLARPARLVLGFTEDFERARRALEGIRLTPSSTDLDDGLLHASAALRELQAREIPGARLVYVFTDLQRSAFAAPAEPATDPAKPPAAEGGGVRTALRRRFEEIEGALGRVILVDVRASAAAAEGDRFPSLAVTDVRHAGKMVLRGRRVPFTARVTNFGKRPATGTVVVTVDREKPFEREFPIRGLEPGRDQTLVFPFAFDRPGWHYVSFKVRPDAASDVLDGDNERWFAVECHDRIRILLVDGEPRPDRPDTDPEAFFLAQALDPGSADGGAPGIVEPVAVAAGDLDPGVLDAFDVVALLNVPELPAEPLKRLEDWVARGGSLLMATGSHFRGDDRGREALAAFNGAFHRGGGGLSPASLTALAGDPDGRKILFDISVDRGDHRAVKYWDDPATRISLSRVRFYAVVEADASAGGAFVARLASFNRLPPAEAASFPALLEKPFGKGRVLLFLSSTDLDFGEFPRFPAVVPFWREIVYDLALRAASVDNIVAGDLFLRTFDDFVREAQLRHMDGTPTRLQLQARRLAGGAAVSRPAESAPRDGGSDAAGTAVMTLRLDPGDHMREAGIYTIAPVLDRAPGAPEPPPGATRETRFAVNPDAAESDLRRMSPDRIRADAGPSVTVVPSLDAETAVASGDPETGGIWKLLLHAMAALLLVETALAQFFGQSQRSVR